MIPNTSNPDLRAYFNPPQWYRGTTESNRDRQRVLAWDDNGVPMVLDTQCHLRPVTDFANFRRVKDTVLEEYENPQIRQLIPADGWTFTGPEGDTAPVYAFALTTAGDVRPVVHVDSEGLVPIDTEGDYTLSSASSGQSEVMGR